jgi:hypothetical protein
MREDTHTQGISGAHRALIVIVVFDDRAELVNPVAARSRRRYRSAAAPVPPAGRIVGTDDTSVGKVTVILLLFYFRRSLV